MALPERTLTQAEVEYLWAIDRANLLTCAELKEALEDFYRVRDEGVTGDA